MGDNYYFYKFNIDLKTKNKYKMIKSILESDYNEPMRPYSIKELEYLRNLMHDSLQLSKYKSYHSKCRHFYYIKKNSRKEKDFLEKKEENDNSFELIDIGNCSVCWKLYKTPKYLKDKAEDVIYYYSENFKEEPLSYKYSLLDLETVFYKWLYYDNFENRNNNKKNDKRKYFDKDEEKE